VLTDQSSTAAESAPLRAATSLSSSTPTDVLVTLTELAAGSAQVTSRYWAQLVASQVEFLTHLFEAMAGDSPSMSNDAGRKSENQVPFVGDRTRAVESASARQIAVGDVPIKRYDDLTVQQIATRIGRLRDTEEVERVLTYEKHNKRRKGVVGAAKQQLKRISDS
jgi:hypothetical protein